MLPIAKKIIPSIALLLVVTCTSAQRNANFIAGNFLEDTFAELHLVQIVADKPSRIAEYKISPGKRDFAFVIPVDTGATYRLQVNLMKYKGRHLEVDKSFTRPIAIHPGQNYTLKIVPSHLDDVKKTGLELKEDIRKSSVALISGKVLNLVVKSGIQVSLHDVANGALLSRNTVQSKTDGAFEIACPVKQEGFYYLTGLRWRVRVYLKPGDRLQMDVEHKSGRSIFVNGSRENLALHQWRQLISPLTSYGYNLATVTTDSIGLDEYMRRHATLQPAMAEFVNKIDKSNPKFIAALKNAIDIDSQLPAIHFLFHKSMKISFGGGRDFKEVPVFYKQFIQPGKFSNASILHVGEAMELMYLYGKLKVASLPQEEREALAQSEKVKLMMNAISNDTLKSMFLNDQMVRIELNNLSEFRETFEPFKKYAKLSPAKETYKKLHAAYIEDTAFIGKSSYDFALPDTSGKIISMKHFKGKIVLVDVWATWCGPCRGEFPHLKEIEEEYSHNKDIVFVGISTDKVEARQKWVDMIKKEKLGGIQLLDDFGKYFGRKYEVTAIPRFMLIDRQGRWIEVRCPRPSAKEDLKRYLDKALANEAVTNTSKK